MAITQRRLPTATGTATEAERDQALAIAALVRRLGSEPGRRQDPPRLVGPDGQAVPLPASLVRVIREAAESLARGDSLTVVPLHTELTTQQAADLLNVSRPYLVRLVEGGTVPCTRTEGGQRRIRSSDLLAYKARRDAERAEGLRALTRMGQEWGLYPEYQPHAQG